MQVTIIGAGNMGRGIGTRLVAGGNDVRSSTATPRRPGSLPGARRRPRAGAAGDPLAVTSSCWRSGTSPRAVVEQYGDQLEGKVVVDITNPVDTDSIRRPRHPGRFLRRRGAGEAGARRRPVREGVQHDLRRDAGRRRGVRPAARRLHRRRRRRREGDSRRARRAADEPDRHRTASPGPRARAPRLPAHGPPGRLGTGYGSTIKVLA